LIGLSLGGAKPDSDTVLNRQSQGLQGLMDEPIKLEIFTDYV
jgi:hypothetical protein